ncbi:MAG: VacJ family lipoprotein [Deltaproteobacteria bacterium]|nr:MAG: VacJ family lipoprotein [Deltaproteobacteria bacterium]
MNRRIFWFNERVDAYVLEPLARGWHAALPDPAERAVVRFFENLRAPVDFANNVLQAKPEAALAVVGRFFINSTLGAGGFLDPATSAGLEARREDFGQTLGRWGVGPGPYLVLPFLGPSTPRDAFGLIPDSFAYVWPYFVDRWVTISTGAVYGVSLRASLLEEVESARKSSLDYYAFVRNAYLQHRRALVSDSPEQTQQQEEDLYYLDFDEE